MKKINRYEILVSQYTGYLKELRSTQGYKNVIAASNALVAAIHKGIKSAGGVVESLIEQEALLQNTDMVLAKTSEEKASIKNAMVDYRSLAEVVSQMRRNPIEYVNSNIGMKNIRMDQTKQPREKGLNQIDGNIIRCGNRALHSTDDMRQVWEARVVLAKETRKALRVLHQTVVADFEKLHKEPVRQRRHGGKDSRSR